MRNDAPLTEEEQNDLIEAILHGREPAWIDRLVALLEAGKPGLASFRQRGEPGATLAQRPFQ